MQKATLFIVFILTAKVLLAQANIDSLLQVKHLKQDTFLFNHYTEIIMHYFSTDLEKAEEYVNLQRNLAEDLNLVDKKIFAKNISAVLYSNKSEYKKAIVIFQDVLKMYKELGNEERVSALLNNISICNMSLGNHLEAIENQMESLRIKEKLGVSADKLAASYWNIGNIHWEISNIDQSTEYYRKAEVIYRELGLTEDLVQIRNIIAINLSKNPDSLDVVIDILNDCIPFYKENNYMLSLAGVYETMGNIRIEQERYAEANDYFVKALDIAEVEGEKSFPGILYRRLATTKRKQNNLEEALFYAKKSLKSAQELGLKKKEIEDHNELSRIYEASGMNAKALDSYKTHKIMYDSILSNEKLVAINELEKKYQTEKKEKEIELLKERARINSFKQKGLVASIIGIGLLALSFLYGQRQKLKRTKVEKAKLNQEIEFTQRALDFKKQELTSFALQLAQKNELLEKLKEDVRNINTDNAEKKKLQSIVNTIHINQSDEQNWENFHTRFKEVHIDFDKKIKTKFDKITSNDLRLLSLIRMNLSSKEIANVLNVSHEGIKKARYRLRKKMELDTEVNLEELIMEV